MLPLNCNSTFSPVFLSNCFLELFLKSWHKNYTYLKHKVWYILLYVYIYERNTTIQNFVSIIIQSSPVIPCNPSIIPVHLPITHPWHSQATIDLPSITVD